MSFLPNLWGNLSKYIDTRPMRRQRTLNQRNYCGKDPERLTMHSATVLAQHRSCAGLFVIQPGTLDSRLTHRACTWHRGTLCAARSLHRMRSCHRTYFNIKEGKRSVQNGMMHGKERPADDMLGSNATDASSEKAEGTPEAIGNATL